MATIPDSPALRVLAQSALDVVNELLMANQNWTVTAQANGQLQWGFPNTTPPTSIAHIPDFLLVANGFSVDLLQYITGPYSGAALAVISGDATGFSLGGADGVVLSYVAGGGAQLVTDTGAIITTETGTPIGIV